MKRIVLLFSFVLLFIWGKSQTWTDVGSGLKALPPFVGGPMYCLGLYNGEVYTSGFMDTAGGVPVRNIAKWNGTNWDSVGKGLNRYGYALAFATFKGKLYVGGDFDSAGGLRVHYIARWDGTKWDTVGKGTNGSIYALAVYNGKLYVGGSFSLAGGISVQNVAVWNDTVWSNPNGGVNDVIDAFQVYKNKLYAGGYNNFYNWNDTTWSLTGGGCNSSVSALAIYNGILYVAGSFDHVSDRALISYELAKWDGTNWSTSWPTLASSVNSTPATLAVYNNELYVGGYFNGAGIYPCDYVIKWTGTAWDTVGRYIMHEYDYALLSYDSVLFACGGQWAPPGNRFIAQFSCNSVPAQPIGITGGGTACKRTSAKYKCSSVGATSYSWILPGGWTGNSTADSINATVGNSGGYVICVAHNQCGSTLPDSLFVAVDSASALQDSSSSPVACGSDPFVLYASGAVSYLWQPGNHVGTTDTVSIPISNTYTVFGTEANGCVAKDSIYMYRDNKPVVTASAFTNTICSGNTVTLSACCATTYTWQPGFITGANVPVSPITTTTYTVFGEDLYGCAGVDSITIHTLSLPTVTYIQSPDTFCVSVSAITL